MRIGSLCSGYGGLDLGLQAIVGGDVAWHSDVDEGACRILTHRYPDVPNLGDLTAVGWARVEPVEWLTAGYPCQPFSLAGKRKGVDDHRHLWPHIARAVRVLRPRFCLFENVAGHVSMGLDVVLADLAALGFDARWGVVRAADAGAPHGRARVFIVARDATLRGWDDPQPSGWRRESSGTPGGSGLAATDSDGARLEGPDGVGIQHPRPILGAAADATGDGRHEGRPESAGLIGRPDAPECGAVAPDAESGGGPQQPCVADAGGALVSASARAGSRDGAGDPAPRVRGLERSAGLAWGAYEPAIRRWEATVGRPAPAPTGPGARGGQRLSPRFVEWMMGLPDGWVCDVPRLSRNAQLKALGNGVVPQQAALALRMLTDAAADIPAALERSA